MSDLSPLSVPKRTSTAAPNLWVHALVQLFAMLLFQPFTPVLAPGFVNPTQTGEAVACVKLIQSLQFIVAQTVRHLCIVECDRPATNAVAKPELCKRCPTFDRRQQFSARDGSVHSQGTSYLSVVSFIVYRRT
jgi:hypothetical protein